MSAHQFFPDLPRFAELYASHGLVPVGVEIIADLDTPLTLFAKIASPGGDQFLFESMEGGEKWGRYSFIGFDPLLTFVVKATTITITDHAHGRMSRSVTASPLPELRRLLNDLHAAEVPQLPRFSGGAVGFLGYDIVRSLENLPDNRAELPCADASFMVPRLVLAHDSFKQKVTLVCWVKSDGGQDAASAYADARQRLLQVVDRLRQPVPASYFTETAAAAESAHQLQSNVTAGQFRAMVERAKQYILAGDIIQVVLSQRFHTETSLSPTVIYRALRQINPSPYLFFLQLGGLTQIGSSPEILVRKTGDTIELRPIAGTRRRGGGEAEDLALEQELLADPKERAEHLMLVDLGRNDVGRVACGGEVEVRDLLVVERYSHVMHLVSGVHGRIAPGKDQFDVVAACFPAGTVSGAPKIRAMQIIDELEPERRGPYAGSVGYFGFSGNMDFCITIRTFVLSGRDLWLQAGAGIVADSDPSREYEETINKSLALRRALELAGKGF